MLAHDDVVDILTLIAGSDGRRLPTEADVSLWSLVLAQAGVRSKDDACQAVIDHLATSTEWIKPFHVIQGVKAIRAARLKAAEKDDRMVPNVDPDRPLEYLAELRSLRAAAAAGTLDADTYAAGGLTLSGAPPLRALGERLTARDISAIEEGL